MIEESYVYQLAELHYKNDDYRKAEFFYKKCFEEDQNKEICAIKLADLYYSANLGQMFVDQAIEYYLVAYNLFPNNPEYILKIASAYYFNREYNNAERFLEQCTTTNLSPITRGICANKLGHVYELQGEKHKALKYFVEARTLDFDHPFYIYDLALAFYNTEDYISAASAFQQCIDQPSSNNFSNMQKADSASKLGYIYLKGSLGEVDVENAIKNYVLAYELAPTELLYLKNLALLYLSVNELDLASDLLLKCRIAESSYRFTNIDKAECSNFLATIQMKTNKLKEAIESSLISHELNPENPVYIYNLAFVYSKVYDYSSSEKFLKKCLEVDFSKDFTNVEKASCSNKLGVLYNQGKVKAVDIYKAVEYFELANHLDPTKAIYIYNLAIHYYANDFHEEAIPFLQDCEENSLDLYNNEMQLDCSAKLLGLGAG